jgi:hypothetical protein
MSMPLDHLSTEIIPEGAGPSTAGPPARASTIWAILTRASVGPAPRRVGARAEVHHALVMGRPRNDQIFSDIAAALARGRDWLVLTRRGAHLHALASLLADRRAYRRHPDGDVSRHHPPEGPCTCRQNGRQVRWFTTRQAEPRVNPPKRGGLRYAASGLRASAINRS